MDIILFLISAISLIFGFLGIAFSYHLLVDQGDAAGVITLVFSFVLGFLGFINPIDKRTESIDKSAYHLFVTDKFVKITTVSGDDMFQTTDHWTITNIDRHVVEKHQNRNIFSIDVGYATYKLVEKPVEIDQ